ncbi:MAG: MBL fold metallo-hydrolase [Candidatus Eremiobacteraeota bacterium]|nr:MBL fold metallo-hydrolase [Candidatus Eremiobacteraeota bacterium]
MVRLSRGIYRLRAPNPSAMTLSGTNTYIVASGDGKAVCIDPGPAMQHHIDAVLVAMRELELTLESIAVTHGHPDHAPGAEMLARITNTPVYAHPNAQFPHSDTLTDNDILRFGQASLRAVDTPGHTFDHLSFYLEDEQALFTGDVVLGEGTVVVAPPGGAMRPYQATLERLAKQFVQARHLYGGHGPAVDDPASKLQEYIDHRRLREKEIVLALSEKSRTIPELVRQIYANVDAILWPAAARQVLAYLIALKDEGRVRSISTGQLPTADESVILEPAWDSNVDAESAAVAQAELGAFINIQILYRYEIIS